MMQKLLRKKSGFTLIELMIVVVIIGVLSAVAIPAFIRFIKRSKTAEATSLTKSMYEGAVTYWNNINDAQGQITIGTAAASSTHCTPAATSAVTTNPISDQKFAINIAAQDIAFRQLSFAPSGPILYRYGYRDAAGSCGQEDPGDLAYTLYAEGDQDDTGPTAYFELSVGVDAESALYHNPGFYTENELD